MLRAVVPVGLGLILLATGCDRLFGVLHVDEQAPDAAQPSTHLVQQTTASDPNVWMLSATLRAPPASGDALVVIGATDRYNLTTPSGGGVSAWSLAASSNTHANLEIWFGISDGTSSTVTITCKCTSTTLGNMRLSASEWAGLAANAVEIGSDAAGSSTPGDAAAPTILTLDRPDLLVFGASVVGTVASDAMGSGTWTALEPITEAPVAQSQWYQLVAEPGSYTGSVTVNGDWDAAIAALRASP